MLPEGDGGILERLPVEETIDDVGAVGNALAARRGGAIGDVDGSGGEAVLAGSSQSDSRSGIIAGEEVVIFKRERIWRGQWRDCRLKPAGGPWIRE